jgi:hypothetical protein
MFRFRRIVVDEVTLLSAKVIQAIQRLDKASTWLLSGTPPIHRYDSINTMAKILGTAVTTFNNQDGFQGFPKATYAVQKAASESFRDFQTVRTAEFFDFIHERAHEFCNIYIRKNRPKAKYPEKEITEHSFFLTGAETAIVAEISQRTIDEACRYNQKPKKAKKDAAKASNEEPEESSNDPEEAIKASKAPKSNKKLKTAKGKIVVQADKPEIKDKDEESKAKGSNNDKQVGKPVAPVDPAVQRESDFNDAIGLSTGPDVAIVNCTSVLRSYHGDYNTLEVLQARLMKQCDTLLTHLRELWASYSLLKSHNISTFLNFATWLDNLKGGHGSDKSIQPLLHQITWAARANPTPPTSYHQTKLVDVKPRSPANIFLNLNLAQKQREIDVRAAEVDTLVEELGLLIRRVRVAEVVGKATRGLPLGKCSQCGSTVTLVAGAQVSMACGHILSCSGCPGPVNTKGNQECSDSECWEPVAQDRVMDAAIFRPAGLPSGAHQFGGRMASAVTLVQGIIDQEQEKVLVFVQSEAMRDHFLEACQEVSLGVSDGTKRAAKAVEDFQKSTSEDKVLLLYITGDDAAGWNLQQACRVVFLAPLVSCSAAEHDDFMRQAIGRVYRPGQQKLVKVYHLWAEDTLEAGLIRRR